MNLSTQPAQALASDMATLLMLDAVGVATAVPSDDRAAGRQTIRAARQKQHVKVTILNNRPGCSTRQGTGPGLPNSRRRLDSADTAVLA